VVINLTNIETTLQFLPNRHQLHSRPEIWAIDLGHPEGPAATIYISSVFPHWLETLFEQINGFAHLNLVNWSIIVVSPEVLYRLDLRAELLEGGSIGPIGRLGLILLLSSQMVSSIQ
jgi:hypothetical protein